LIFAVWLAPLPSKMTPRVIVGARGKTAALSALVEHVDTQLFLLCDAAMDQVSLEGVGWSRNHDWQTKKCAAASA
jgi:hypothetical protein